jgi:VWFA-related protein
VRRAACLALFLPLALAADEKPAARIVRSEQVVRLVVDAYVTDANGDPIPDLLPSDFVVKADHRVLEVESAEFVAAGTSEGPGTAPQRASGASVAAPSGYPPGRLIVLFLEGDIGRLRTKGLMRVRKEMFRLFDRLLPSDRVAVVRFFSHLTVLCDFTDDRATLEEAIRLGLGSSPDRDVRISPAPSLGAHLDFAEARRAAHVERALELVASALAPIPGAKAVVFAGWGFFANRSPVEEDLYGRALAALMRARANVFTLDTSDADWHTLETTLQMASQATGGTYAKTHVFPGQAVERIARALQGRYVLVCVGSDAAPHALDVSLAGRRGDVVARAYTAAP